MTISHKTAQEWVQDSLQKPLAGTQRATLEEHLASCPDCRAFQRQLSELHQRLPQATACAWPEPSYSKREMEQKLAALQRNHRRIIMNTRISSFARAVTGIAAAALLILVIAFAMKTLPGKQQSPGSSNQTPQETQIPTPVTISQPISYTSPRTGLTLTIPAGWESQGEDTFKGPDGFLEIAPLNQQAASLTQACELEANSHPELYGQSPEAHWTLMDPYRACVILTSMNNIEKARSTIILEYPQEGQFITLTSDPVNFMNLVASLRFPQPVATATPISYPAIVPNPPVSEAQQQSDAFGSLIWEDYNIVPSASDNPNHFEFNKRIPQFVFDQRRPWRDNSIQMIAQRANTLLAPFGYQLKPELWSSVSPDMYALYKGDQIAQADISIIRPVSVNASGTDFVMVVDTLNSTSKLIQKDKIENWDASIHAYTYPVYAGDDLVTLERDMNAGDVIRVLKGGQTVFTFSTVFVVEEPVKMLAAYQGHWVLEVDGLLIVDGKILNQELGYTEIFNWQLLHDKPFYFFSKDGKVGMSYGGEVLPVQYDRVIHYACCEPAMFNPRSYPDLVAFYALKDGNWHYVELGDYTQMPAMEPTPTPIPVTSDLCRSADANKYEDPQSRFCFAYPARFQQGETTPGQPGIFGPPADNSLEPVRASLTIEIQPLQIETDLKTAVDIFLSQYDGTAIPEITRTPGLLGSDPAEIVETIPGRGGSRDVFTIHGKWLYHLVFTPSSDGFPQIKADLEELFQTVMHTFTFLN